ncbi:MAG: protein phosphatase CheZ [candidate division Zixibacteria bacterium]|nr:protein phosphatase CheZ [candidate division Zixibacteria bacterium]
MSGNETKDVYSGQFSSKLRVELEQLTGSINDIMKNMRKMQNPILESSEQLPVANEQLDKITAQTEQATHKMLDMVEQIIEHQEQMTILSDEFGKFLKRSRSKDRDVFIEKVKRINEMSSISQNNAFVIMDALQFQDITSQQIQHASSLLEDIGVRLQHLLAAFDGKELSDDIVLAKKKDRAYDPNADLYDGKDQNEVDNIVNQVVKS